MENATQKTGLAREYKAMSIQDVAVTVGVQVVTLYVIIFIVAEVDIAMDLPESSPYLTSITKIQTSFNSAIGMIGLCFFILPCVYVLQLLNLL